MSLVLSISLTISRPPPSRPSEIAVVRTIAMVMVTFRRRPLTTSLSTKLARIGGRSPPYGRVGSGSAADAVDAAGLVAHHAAEVQLDDSAPHRVHNRMVVCGHQHRGAGAVD